MSDEITSLKEYIETNLERSSGAFEYVIQPNIRNIVSNLSETDSEKFSIEILNWNEDVLYHLADEILFSNNEYLDKDYIYCSIFLRIKNKENLDFLSQYLYDCYRGLNFEKIPLDFFLQLKEKVEDFYIIKNGKENVNHFISPLDDIINKKMTQNKTYIQSYITIQNNEIVLNGNSVFKIEPTDFADFSKQAYRNFEMQYPKFFKMDALSKLAFLGSELLLSPITSTEQENNIALVLANKSSSLDTDVKYQESISDKENYYPSPAVFVYTLPNICLGEISIRHQLKSENSFFIFDAFNTEFMSNYSNILLNTNKADVVLCGWVEYFNDNYKAFLCTISTEENANYTNETINTLYNK